MGKIFINYRTADEPYGAALLDRALSDQFGSDVVFRAPKSVPLGDDFKETILGAVRSSSVLLAVIGPNWLTATDENGCRRLDDPDDFVRKEIAEAFNHGVRVVPILMNATRITRAKLPPDIAKLATCQDVRVHFRNSHFDLPSLIERLRKLMPNTQPAPAKTATNGAGGIHADNVGTVIYGDVNVKRDVNFNQTT